MDDDEELRALARERAVRALAARASDDGRLRALLEKRERARGGASGGAGGMNATSGLYFDEDGARDAAAASARASLPMSFGKQPAAHGGGGGGGARGGGAAAQAWAREATKRREDEDDEDARNATTTNDGRNDDDDDDDESNYDDDEYEEDAIPMSSEAIMDGFRKPATACAVDRSGIRCAAGSSDGVVRLYDFTGMKRDLQAFRTLTPREGYPVHAIDWSPSGDQFVVATGASQATVHDRDGVELGEFDKGDMYIRDLKNTKGHVSGLTDVKWNPIDRGTICTASEDGSARLWDVNYLGDARGSQKAVLKPQLLKPGRVHVTSCAYSHDGDMIACGVTDGSVQIFTSKGSGYKSATVGLVLPPSQQCHLDNHWSYNGRPSHLFKTAHPVGEEVTSLSFARDGRTLLSRCADGTLNVWDVRNVKAPLKRFEDLPTRHSETVVGWSPNDVYFYTGVDAERDGRGNAIPGGLCFFSREKLEMVRRVSTPTNCIAATWHPRLNQIFVGCGDAKGGEMRVLYDTKTSQGGVIPALGKRVRKSNDADFARIDVQEISYTPNALPAFKEPMPGKRKLDATDIARQALKKTPKQPKAGQDKNGILSGGTGGTLLTQQIMLNNDQLGEKNWMTMDARESILRHAEAAAKNPKFTKQAYEQTQPTQIWNTEDEDGAASD